MCVKRVKIIVLQLKYRKVLRWLREDPISWLFFFFFFCYDALFVFRYKKPYAT